MCQRRREIKNQGFPKYIYGKTLIYSLGKFIFLGIKQKNKDD
jgi:hypothetical protein